MPQNGTPLDRRREPDDRRAGGRRSNDRIVDIRTHPAVHVTVRAFAEYLGVRWRTVLKWIKTPRGDSDGNMVLPAYKFAGELRIRTSDAVAFCEQSRIRAPCPSAEPASAGPGTGLGAVAVKPADA